MLREQWSELAACRRYDTELFFPVSGDRVRIAEAKAVCQACPVIEECREWALEHERVGVWGGTSEQERRMMRRRLRIKVQEPQSSILVAMGQSRRHTA